MMETLLVIALIATVILILVGLAVVLHVLEHLFPALSRWLDSKVGPDDGSGW